MKDNLDTILIHQTLNKGSQIGPQAPQVGPPSSSVWVWSKNVTIWDDDQPENHSFKGQEKKETTLSLVFQITSSSQPLSFHAPSKTHEQPQA